MGGVRDRQPVLEDTIQLIRESLSAPVTKPRHRRSADEIAAPLLKASERMRSGC